MFDFRFSTLLSRSRRVLRTAGMGTTVAVPHWFAQHPWGAVLADPISPAVGNRIRTIGPAPAKGSSGRCQSETAARKADPLTGSGPKRQCLPGVADHSLSLRRGTASSNPSSSCAESGTNLWRLRIQKTEQHVLRLTARMHRRRGRWRARRNACRSASWTPAGRPTCGRGPPSRGDG